MNNKFKFFALFLSLAALAFTACSDDDDKKIEFKASAIVGIWDIDAMTTTVVTYEGTETGVQEPDIRMDFKEDGTGVASNETAFTWSLSGNLLSLTFEGLDDEADGPPTGIGTGGEFNFSFELLTGFETITLTVTDLEESYMAVEYALSYPGMSMKMVMELSK